MIDGRGSRQSSPAQPSPAAAGQRFVGKRPSLVPHMQPCRLAPRDCLGSASGPDMLAR